MSVADDVLQQITKRLKQLKPLVEEYHQLEGMLRKLASGDGASSSTRYADCAHEVINAQISTLKSQP